MISTIRSSKAAKFTSKSVILRSIQNRHQIHRFRREVEAESLDVDHQVVKCGQIHVEINEFVVDSKSNPIYRFRHEFEFEIHEFVIDCQIRVEIDEILQSRFPSQEESSTSFSLIPLSLSL